MTGVFQPPRDAIKVVLHNPKMSMTRALRLCTTVSLNLSAVATTCAKMGKAINDRQNKVQLTSSGVVDVILSTRSIETH